MFQPLLRPLLGPLLRSPMGSGNQTLIQRAISILRRYGQDAHIYLPGVGMLNGLQAGNYLDSALTTPAAIDNPVGGVVDAIGGINAIQPTTASKPILRRGAVNLLTYSGDFSNAAWGLQMSATKSANTVTFTSNANSSIELSQTISGGTASKTFTVAALVSCTSGTVAFRLKNTHATVVDNFSPELVATTTPQMFVFTVTNSAAAGNSAQTFALVNSATSPAIGTLTSGGCALFQGTYTAAQIQALGGIPLTTTAPASTALGPTYWAFDGSNDSLSLGGPLFQAGDNCAVICGVNLAGDATFSAVVAPSGNSGSLAQVASIWKTNTNRLFGLWRDDAGVERGAYGTTSVAGMTVVAATKTQLGVGLLRINGVQADSVTTPVGVTTLNSGVIGNRPGGASPTNGNIYPVIAIKGTVPDADLLLLEKFVGQLSGVTI